MRLARNDRSRILAYNDGSEIIVCNDRSRFVNPAIWRLRARKI
ncbi:hypothetical protein [Helicobacter sp. T3_23-1056]